MPEQLQSGHLFEVFYDGDCPLCRREIDMLSRWDRHDRILFTDLTAAGFQPSALGLSMDTLMAEIHGRMPDGSLVKGVEVFRQLYGHVGFGWAVPFSRWPGVRHGLDLAYTFFARYRLKLTGRCDSRCQVEEPAS